jgi:TatA/E family protein of Tat protein translocase
MPQLSPVEILVILVVALVVFGPSKLPEMGRQVGRAMREFRHFQESVRRDIGNALNEEPAPPDRESDPDEPDSSPPTP